MGTTIEIPLTQGYKAIVSIEDIDLCQYHWNAAIDAGYNVYARRNAPSPKRGTIRMHRIILERILGRPLSTKDFVDHIDGNGLNNTRENLRLATHSQNITNSKLRSTNKSGYKGVYFYPKSGKWVAQITKDHRHKHLGYFNSPEEAHDAIMKIATEIYGEFWREN